MIDRPSKLASLQAWMQEVVTDPRGPAAGVAGDGARRHLQVDLEEVESVVTPSSRLSGLERLGIYNRAFRARLLECFRAEYPCLHHALGDDLFTLFVSEYLEAHPPRGHTLGRLGAELPSYLERTRPEAAGESWAEFLVDLATLERTYLEVYDGEGSEGEALLAADDLFGLPAGAFRDLRLRPVRGLRVLHPRSAVHEYFRTVREGSDPERLPAPGELSLAVYRRAYVVRFLRLTSCQATLLATLGEGGTVAQALASMAPPLPESEARRAVLSWADEGLLLEHPQGR